MEKAGVAGVLVRGEMSYTAGTKRDAVRRRDASRDEGCSYSAAWSYKARCETIVGWSYRARAREVVGYGRSCAVSRPTIYVSGREGKGREGKGQDEEEGRE